MKLHYLPGACSLAVHIVLEWIGAPYSAQAVSRDALKSPEFLKISPQGSVPCLEDGGFALTQNAAILDYLNDKFPEALVFGSQDIREKAEARRWLMFCNADLHKAFVPLFAPDKFVDGPAQDTLKRKAAGQIQSLYAVADKALENKEFFSSKKSAADAYFFVVTRWAQALQIDLGGLENVRAHFERMSADKGVQAALAAEGL